MDWVHVIIDGQAVPGAERLWLGDGRCVLRDPTGLVFCITGNPPD